MDPNILMLSALWPRADVNAAAPIAAASTGREKPSPGERVLLCGRPDPLAGSVGCMGKRQMRNRVFHQARIAGMTFEGVMTGSGPTLSCPTNGGVALGVSGLRHFQPQPWDHVALRRLAGGS